MFEKSFVKSDSILSREDIVNETENTREKRRRVEQTNAVVAKKIFEPIVNPLKKIVTVESDIRIDSHLLTTNETDSYYEPDHSSEYASDFSTNEYSTKIIHDQGARERFEDNNFIGSRYQRKKWTNGEEEEEVAAVTTAYELDVWDDPNKLVDRLRVLIAEQNMGIRIRNIILYLII